MYNLSFVPNTLENYLEQMLMNGVVEELPVENEPTEPRQRYFRTSSFSVFLDYIDVVESLDEDRDIEDSTFVTFQYFNGDEISRDQIGSLPSFQVDANLLKNGMQCSVCLDDFSLGDKAKRLPCNHFYHEKCITSWLEEENTCPICRDVVRVP